MTEEELSRAMRERAALMNTAPKPSLERRLEYLEADGSAQRTAILKLEKALKLLARAWSFFIFCVALALMLKMLP